MLDYIARRCFPRRDRSQGQVVDRRNFAELLEVPEAISQEFGQDLRRLAHTMVVDINASQRQVFLLFSAGTRPQDAENYGPGTIYAYAIIKKLYEKGIRCLSELMFSEDSVSSRDMFYMHLAPNSAVRHVMVVLQTQALFQSRHALKAIFTAQEGQFELLPLRFEDNLPSLDQQWTEITKTDLEGLVMLTKVQDNFCQLNSIPSPPYTVVQQPTIVDDVVKDVKVKLRAVKKKAPQVVESPAAPLLQDASPSVGNPTAQDASKAYEWTAYGARVLPAGVSEAVGSPQAGDVVTSDAEEYLKRMSLWDRYKTYGWVFESKDRPAVLDVTSGEKQVSAAAPSDEEEAQRQAAAVKIQKVHRGTTARKKLAGAQSERKTEGQTPEGPRKTEGQTPEGLPKQKVTQGKVKMGAHATGNVEPKLSGPSDPDLHRTGSGGGVLSTAKPRFRRKHPKNVGQGYVAQMGQVQSELPLQTPSPRGRFPRKKAKPQEPATPTPAPAPAPAPSPTTSPKTSSKLLAGVPPCPQGKCYHFFLSHNKNHSHFGNASEQVALNLNDLLESRGWLGFFDIDDMDGTSSVALTRNVQASCALIVVLSDETCQSQWCVLEWKVAQEYEIPVLCVMDLQRFNKQTVIGQVQATNPYLLNNQWVEYTDMRRKAAANACAEFLALAVKSRGEPRKTGEKRLA